MLGHLDDLESDFSAIHRIDDIGELPAVKFLRLAYRMDAYRGVMRARVEDQAAKDEPTLSLNYDDVTEIESSQQALAALQSGPGAGGLFDFQ